MNMENSCLLSDTRMWCEGSEYITFDNAACIPVRELLCYSFFWGFLVSLSLGFYFAVGCQDNKKRIKINFMYQSKIDLDELFDFSGEFEHMLGLFFSPLSSLI